jgi:hypothetical protein
MSQQLRIGDVVHTKGGDCCVRQYGCVRRRCVSRIHHQKTADGIHMICEDCPEDAECWTEMNTGIQQ